MAFKPFRTLRVGPNEEVTPKVVNDLQANIGAALAQLLGKDPLDLQILPNVALSPGVTNMVPHKLGRNLQGWWIIRTHGSYNMVGDMQDNNPSPHLLLYLVTPAPVTVDILVF